MLWKRTTAPDGIPGSPGPPAAASAPSPARRNGIARTSRTVLKLARWLSQLEHRPTRGQLWLMARLGGRRPASYRLDAAVNPLPPGLPTDFPYGTDGLCFAHAGGEVVALPDGCGFSL